MNDELVLERPGCAVHVWLSGASSAPLLVMLHGAGLDHHMFDPQAEVFSQRYRLALVDVRAHGKSRPIERLFSIADARDDLLALLDALHIDAATVLGQSMGGNIAQEVVFAAPTRVSALVAVDCACNTLPLSPFNRALQAISPALLKMMPERMLWAGTEAVSKQPEVRRYLSATIRQHSKAQIVEITTATLDALHAELDYRSSCPLLIVRGAHDNAGAIREQAPRWAARDRAAYVQIPNAGHMSNMDNPAAFNRAVLAFLEQS
jgi:3-oxoadipate enol-lactonase